MKKKYIEYPTRRNGLFRLFTNIRYCFNIKVKRFTIFLLIFAGFHAFGRFKDEKKHTCYF